LIKRLISWSYDLNSMKICTFKSSNCGTVFGKLLSGTKLMDKRKSKDLRLYMKFSQCPSGGDLLAVESFELFITGLTSGEPIRGDMVMDEGGDMTLLSS
jgi:hypothetical protein